MHRSDWLLLLLNGGIDPIRVQKGMFLFAMEGGRPAAERYSFEPYNWGPMSRAIYRDLEQLIDSGLAERVGSTTRRYPLYRRTSVGREAAVDLERRAPKAGLVHIDRIRSLISTVSFDALLRTVYDRYPEYATKSLFVRP